uniref:Uncharacterized protein n=1 Tax=Arundo donax TaxID=35708 RepID=A0A0A9H746_ARUDO
MWWMFQSLVAASANSVRTDSIRATGANTSSKSTPCRWTKPLATSRALCFTTFPRSSLFTLNTHFNPIG